MNPVDRVWLSCDWGSTHLRLRAVDVAGMVRGTVRSGQGVSALAGDDEQGRAARFQTALAEQVGQLAGQCRTDLEQCTIVISGMASSSIGWQSLPYAQVPYRLDGSDATWRDVGPLPQLPRSRVILISGVRTDRDVMRGEETEVLGAAAWLRSQDRVARALLVLPGTHSKHVELDGQAMTDFRTYLTGELFNLLTTHSVLRHSTVRVPSGIETTDAFQAGVRSSQQTSLAAALFQVRTRELLAHESPLANTAFLSGLLIGAEIRDLANRAAGMPIVLCASGALHEAYGSACREVGLGDQLIAAPPDEVEQFVVRGQRILLEQFSRVAAER